MSPSPRSAPVVVPAGNRGALAVVLGASLVALGCGPRGEVPPLAASSDAPTAGEQVADDPVRRELRGLYALCEVRREALVAELDHAERRYTRIRGAAALAWLLGTLAGGAGPNPEVFTESECIAPDGAGVGTSRCDPQTVPVVGDAVTYDPAREDVRTVALDARQQLGAINRAIDQTDALLFANPDPAAWSEAERAQWEALRAVLQGLCE